MNNLGMVKEFLNGMNKLGMRVVEVEIDNKATLQQVRKHIKDNDLTEAKLLYRSGKYVMTVIMEKVDHLGLVCAGFVKATPQEKKVLEEMYKPVLREYREVKQA